MNDLGEKMRQFFVLFLLLTSFTVFSWAEEEPIIVRLATENKLMPIYLTKFYSENGGFNQAYIQKLENVLLFDLNHN